MFEFVFDFVSQLGTMNLLLVLAVFVVFIFLMKKVMKTLLNMIWISIASAAFPFVLGFMGYSVPLNIDTIIFFIIMGIGLYFIYIFARIVYTALGIIEKGAKIVAFPVTQHSKSRKEKTQKKMEEFIKEREQQQKEMEKLEKEKKK